MRPPVIAVRAVAATLVGVLTVLASASCSGGGTASTTPSVVGGVPVTAVQPPNGKLCLTFERRIWMSDLTLPGPGPFNGGFSQTGDLVGEFTPDSSGFHLKIPMRVDPNKTSCT
jgi:hypothetical protein